MAKLKPRLYFPALCWAILILTVSSIPHLPPLTEKIKIGDKIAHFLEYFIFGLLVAHMFRKMNKSILRILLLTSIIGTIYGILDELHQLFIPGRTTDPLDMTADALGAILASLIYIWWQSRRTAPILPQPDKH
jgi:VanZ family protein